MIIKTKWTHRNKWTLSKIKDVASQFTSKIEFKTEAQPAYASAMRKGILEEVCSHMTSLLKHWTKEEIIQESLKYNHKCDFKKGNMKAFCSARHNNWLDEACSHMTPKLKWDFESVKTKAQKYISREDFARGAPGAYGAAKRKGWLNEVCNHMINNIRSDSDTVYVWNVPGTDICKIGVTSMRLGTLRIKEVAKKMGVNYKIIAIKNTKHALKLERTLLNVFNKKVKLPAFTGSTEFRMIPLNHLVELQNIIRYHQ